MCSLKAGKVSVGQRDLMSFFLPSFPKLDPFTMPFSSALATACSTFALTNIDDTFVLVTFFAEASTSQSLTALKITIGQYVGFTVIIIVSMIGFGASLVLPSEPIGFFGLLPALLGVWKGLGLMFPKAAEDDVLKDSKLTGMKSVSKVAIITIMNGGDNIGTYIPLFSQTKGAEIAVYVVTYYVLLGLLCLIAFLIMRQKHILAVAQRYATFVIPFLYMGLGIFIIVKSSCYPWSIEQIDEDIPSHPGKIVMGVVTSVVILVVAGVMLHFRVRAASAKPSTTSHEEHTEITVIESEVTPPETQPKAVETPGLSTIRSRDD